MTDLSKLSREELVAELRTDIGEDEPWHAYPFLDELARRLGDAESSVTALAKQNLEIEATSLMRYDEICVLDDEVKDLKAALKALTEWRDISTAPKDGTKFLILFPHGDVEAVRYFRLNTGDEPTLTTRYVLPRPTHWLPLPPPPKGKGEGE